MKNYIFLNLEDTYSLSFEEGGTHVRVMLDSWDIDPKDFSDDDENWAKLVILKNKNAVIFMGNVTAWDIGSELLIYASREETDPEILDWGEISKDPTLTKEFIETHKNDLFWYELARHYEMDEDFIERYMGRLNWSALCSYQKLSEEFVEKHADKIVWYGLHTKQNFSDEFIEKHRWHMEQVR